MDKKHNLDLMYFTNPNFCRKNNIKNPDLEIDVNEVAFYKNRIQKTINDLLDGKKINNVVDATFNNFLKKTMEYYKFVDKSDIIQKEYNDIKKNKLSPIKIKNKFTLEDTNGLVVKKIIDPNMRTYVKVKKPKKRRRFHAQKKILISK